MKKKSVVESFAIHFGEAVVLSAEQNRMAKFRFTGRSIYNVPTFTCGQELWVVTETTRSRIQASEMSLPRYIKSTEFNQKPRFIPSSSVTNIGLLSNTGRCCYGSSMFRRHRPHSSSVHFPVCRQLTRSAPVQEVAGVCAHACEDEAELNSPPSIINPP